MTISELTPLGALLVIVLMICTGMLIPRWLHIQRINDYKDQISLLRQIVEKRDAQLDAALKPGHAAVKVLEDIKEAAATK